MQSANSSRTRSRSQSSAVDRLPPHAQDAEKALLSCCLLDPQRCMAEVVAASDVDLFYDLRHKSIWDAMKALYDQKKPVEAILVMERLKAGGTLEAIGGPVYLSELSGFTPSSLNFTHYLDSVYNAARSRRMISICTEAISDAFERHQESGYVDGALKDIASACQTNRYQHGRTIAQMAQEAIAQMERDYEAHGQPTGIRTGLHELDRLTSGLHPKEFTVIAGRPSVGKSTLLQTIVQNCCVLADDPIPTLLFSAEMPGEQVVRRMMLSTQRISNEAFRRGTLAQEDFMALSMAKASIEQAPLYIEDRPNLFIEDVIAISREHFRKHGIKLIAIDYLQLLHSHNPKAEKRHLEIADITGGCKNLSMELGIPVIALSQLSRDVEKNERRPRLSDLKESGSLEQDSDNVLLIYEEKENEERNQSKVITIIIGKQRNGPKADVDLLFTPSMFLFESKPKMDDEDVPPPPQYKD